MLKLRERTARNLEDFIKIVSELATKENQPGESFLWFRGQASAQSLVPRFYRNENEDLTTKAEDDENRELFAVRAQDLSSDVKPANNWDWYFVMQHYGAPTRLLNWTEGALHGLYFAVRHNKGCDDAAVWVLNPWTLNGKVMGKEEVIPPGDPGTTRKHRQRFERWLRDRFAKGQWARWPVAIYPGYFMRRISAQRSCFTIHGKDRRGLEELAQELRLLLTKIVIPSWKVGSIKETLLTCGIDETTVFPDLEGIGRAFDLCWNTPTEKKPHCGFRSYV